MHSGKRLLCFSRNIIQARETLNYCIYLFTYSSPSFHTATIVFLVLKSQIWKNAQGIFFVAHLKKHCCFPDLEMGFCLRFALFILSAMCTVQTGERWRLRGPCKWACVGRNGESCVLTQSIIRCDRNVRAAFTSPCVYIYSQENAAMTSIK